MSDLARRTRPVRPFIAAQGVKISAGQLHRPVPGEFTYSVIDTPKATAACLDKRGTHRLRTRLRSGLLCDRRNKVIVDCLIRDRSRNGARLRLAADRPLPQTFVLSDEGEFSAISGAARLAEGLRRRRQTHRSLSRPAKIEADAISRSR